MKNQDLKMDYIVLNLGHAQTVHQWGNSDISSPFVRIYYVKKGKAQLHFGNRDVDIIPGYMYFVPNYMPHSYECEPGFEFYYLFIYQRTARNNLFDIYDIPIEVKANEATQLLFENYCHLYPQLHFPSHDAEAFDRHVSYREYAQAYMQMEDYERLQLHGMVEIILSYYLKHSTPKSYIGNKRINAIIEYITTHISNPISIDDLADKACLTKSYLIRMFRQEMEITPLQFVISRKIQVAQNLLLETDKSVLEIAKSVGFSDVSYFIRLFKKNIGFTPQEYREKLIG